MEVPDAAPEQMPRSRAKRWMPFGPFERLTVNPDTKLISVGTHPSFRVKSGDEELGPAPGTAEPG
jgi:hypothetical protein